MTTIPPATILAVGRMRDKAQRALWEDYAARMKGGLLLHEIEGRTPAEEERKILAKLAPRAPLFVLDERGESLPSTVFANRLAAAGLDGAPGVQFVIGGADGLGEPLRARADTLFSFGRQTWPHMLVRIMLAEQIYRARQIAAGHPYHRE